MLSLLPQPAAPRLALDIPVSSIDVPDKRYEMLYNDNSPLSSPQSADDSNPINLSQPMSAPHNQLRYPSNQRNPSSSFYPTPDSAIDHRRMSEPALLNGSHPSAYRSLDSRYNYASSYSPPSLHYPASSRPPYATHSRTDSNASSTDYRSQHAPEDAFSDPSNHSPRPSTGSTGAVESTVQVQSLSPHSSVSPDISTQALSKDQNPSSPSNPNKTYAFVSLPGTTIRKRPRRRYDEIERLYHCSWPECTKSYGTLNHLNAHVVMQKHGSRRLPSEFKELRKQWRKAKKEGSFTPQPTASGQSPSTMNSYPPQSINPYYQASAGMQNPMSDRRRRMTDSSLPGIASYRTSNPYLQPGVGSQAWMDHNQDRRYSISMTYPSEATVVDDVYGHYDNSSLSATNDQMTGYTPYTTQDQYTTTTHGYTYPPLQSPPAEQSNGSPHSPPNRTGQRLTSTTTLPPLPSTNNLPINRLPSDNGMILNPLDYRSTSGGTGTSGGTNGDSPSAGSEYDEPRSSYQLQSTSGGYGTYEESVHAHSNGTPNSEYSLGRNRLPRDSTLLTPVNIDGLRYGKDI